MDRSRTSRLNVLKVVPMGSIRILRTQSRSSPVRRSISSAVLFNPAVFSSVAIWVRLAWVMTNSPTTLMSLSSLSAGTRTPATLGVLFGLFRNCCSLSADLIFSFDTLTSRLRELAFLNKGLTITIRDERLSEVESAKPKERIFHYKGGIAEFVQYVNNTRQTVGSKPFYMEKEQDDVTVEIALQYNDQHPG